MAVVRVRSWCRRGVGPGDGRRCSTAAGARPRRLLRWDWGFVGSCDGALDGGGGQVSNATQKASGRQAAGAYGNNAPYDSEITTARGTRWDALRQVASMPMVVMAGGRVAASIFWSRQPDVDGKRLRGRWQTSIPRMKAAAGARGSALARTGTSSCPSLSTP